MSVLPHNDQTGQPATQRIGVWSVVWRNSYIPLPPGFPRCVLRVETPLAKGQGAGQCPADVNECWEEMREYGYCVSWHLEAPPARTLPLESKQRIRRRNLWKRLLKKYPMFIEGFYQEAVEARPDYYGPHTLGEFADVQFARTTQGALKMIAPEPPR